MRRFHLLAVAYECTQVHGYKPGEYQSQSTLAHRAFPIQTKTACQLKWTWSTVFLTTGTTASCHRTNHHEFDKEVFDFHNTPEKIGTISVDPAYGLQDFHVRLLSKILKFKGDLAKQFASIIKAIYKAFQVPVRVPSSEKLYQSWLV
jgi:hypothetical protein